MSPSAHQHPMRIAREAMRREDGKSWRLEDLHDVTGYSISHLSMFENGLLPVRYKREKIAEVLKTTPEILWPYDHPTTTQEAK